MVENICIYGDSSKHYTVALVVPNPAQLRALAGGSDVAFEDLCKEPRMEQAVLRELQLHAKKCKYIDNYFPQFFKLPVLFNHFVFFLQVN